MTKPNFRFFAKIIPEKYVNSPLILDSGHEIDQVSCFKYLGVELDSSLNFKQHFDSVNKRISGNLGYLYGLKRYLNDKVMSIMLNSHVHSMADYCIDI